MVISKADYVNDRSCNGRTNSPMGGLVTWWCYCGYHDGDRDSKTVDVDVYVDVDVDIYIDVDVDVCIDIDVDVAYIRAVSGQDSMLWVQEGGSLGELPVVVYWTVRVFWDVWTRR